MSRTTSRAFLAASLLGGALLVGCSAQPLRLTPIAQYERFTDTDAYDTRDIRPDTEVPNQYPEGRAGDQESEPEGLHDREAETGGTPAVPVTPDANEEQDHETEDTTGEDLGHEDER